MKKHFALATLALVSTLALADASLQSTMTAQKVTGPADKEVLVPADVLRPGEVLQYSLKYENKTSTSLKKVEFVLPIPRETEYTPAPGMSAPEQASVNGTSFEKVPLKRKVKNSQGKETVEDVSPAEYRFLKWTKADMPAGQKLNFLTRVTAKK